MIVPYFLSPPRRPAATVVTVPLAAWTLQVEQFSVCKHQDAGDGRLGQIDQTISLDANSDPSAVAVGSSRVHMID